MNNFCLIDLISQREAVKAHLNGLSEDKILNWLSMRGKVERFTKRSLDKKEKQVYFFTSSIGIEARIFFDNDEMIFIGYHSTLK